MEILASIIIISILLFTPQTPKSKVILLDNSKKTNSIVISNKLTTIKLDKPQTYIDLSSKSKDFAIKKISNQELENQYGTLTKMDKYRPVSVLFYFKNNSDLLDLESKTLLPQLKDVIEDRGSCCISIIGHSDRAGDDKSNIKLSLKRAKKIQQYINSLKLTNIVQTKVKSYGENDPIIKTKDGVSEPKNRRVEVLIR